MRFARILFTLLFATAASAQTFHTFVSAAGSDLNDCTRPFPCRTFATAYTHTLPEGTIIALDQANFGPLTITSSVTVDGGAFAGPHQSGGVSITINITDFVNDPAATVVLRSVNMQGFGDGTGGVRIFSAKKVIMENCRIYGHRAGAGRGVDITTSVPNLSVFIHNCTISGNGAQGIVSLGAPGGATMLNVENTRIVQNGASAIDLLGNTRATVVNCSLNENGSAGVFAEAGSTDADVAHTSMEHNVIAASALNGAAIRLFDSVLTHNLVSINGNVLSHGNNVVINNNANPLPAILPPPTLQ